MPSHITTCEWCRTPQKVPSSVVNSDERAQRDTEISQGRTYPTPPDSNRLQDRYDTNARNASHPTSLAGEAEKKSKYTKYTTPAPTTTTKQMDTNNNHRFTPFHDLKEEIDDLIRELPAGFEDLNESDDGFLVERLETRNGTQLSLFLYSPSKRGAEFVHRKGEQPKKTDTVDLGVPPHGNRRAINFRICEPHRHSSVFQRAGHKLKRAFMLFVPHTAGVGVPGGNKSCNLHTVTKPEELDRNDMGPRTKEQNTFRTPARNSQSKPSRKELSRTKLHMASRPRTLSLPIITANDSALEYRRPEDITSTVRKPLPTPRDRQQAVRVVQNSPRHLPRIHEVVVGTSQPHSPPCRVRSQIASMCDVVTLEHEIALARAPIDVKAAASLCVMAMAAGAEFLAEDCRARSRMRRSRVRGGYRTWPWG